MSVGERYRILDRLGAGGLGVVHRAEDRATGKVVALKVMPRTSGAANLRGEFLALARLSHPNIVEVYDYGLTEQGQDYFSMRYVAGPPLLEAVAEIPSPGFYQLIGGVLRGLAMVHARGMVHADIKPSNILVDAELLEQSPIDAGLLADFGLATTADDPAAGEARGTLSYAAPEVYAGRLDARSDLYALGVVLYELTCRRKPHAGATAGELLAAQRRGPPTPPHEIDARIPRALSELIVAMLDPTPGARPQTADEVLARINQLAGTRFDIAETRPLVDMGGLFVGRERDLESLLAMWRSAEGGRGGVALVAGEEGIGKSRLLRELELAVVAGGGRAFSTSVAAAGDAPLTGVAQLVRTLLANLGGRPLDRSLRGVLAPLLGSRGTVPRLDRSSRYALAEAVTEVLLLLAGAGPVLLVVDDLQRADGATVELIAYLARSVGESRVLLAIGARDPTDDPTDGGHAVARVDDAIRAAARATRLDLPPLDRGSVRRLIERGFGGEIADALAADLHRATGGNPAHAAAALEQMVASGQIGRERGRWYLAASGFEIPLAPDLIAGALARLRALGPDAQEVLEGGSALGETFERSDLVAILDGEEIDIDRALAALAEARLIEADAAAGAFRFAHAGVARALYDQLTIDRRGGYHRVAADRLTRRRAASEPISATALARHLFAIGDPRAVEVGLEAADERAASYDHHGALAWCDRVRALGPDDEVAARVAERTGQLRALLGDVEGASAAYQIALDLRADDPAEHVRLALELGELERRVGRGERALEILMTARSEAQRHRLGHLEARCQLRIGWVLMYRADYVAAMEHAVAGHMLARSAEHVATSAELGRLRGTIEIYRGDTRAALDHLAVALGDAESAGDDSLVAGVLHAIGHAAIHAGDYPRAIDALEKAIEVSSRTGNIEQTAKSLNNLGAACYFQGDWQRARSSWDQFRQLCERLDERTELVRALSNLGSLYRDLGQFAQAREALERAGQIADLTGHAHGAAMVTANLGEVWFRDGELAAARDAYQRALVEFERIGAREDVIETRRRMCEVDVATGKLTEAIERSVDAARDAREAGTVLEEGVLHRVAATALRLHGDIDSAEWFIGRAREILTELGSRYELAKVDLETAEIEAACGRTVEAGRHLDAATRAFGELGARWDLNLARARTRSLRGDSAPRSQAATNVGLDLLLELTQALGTLEVEKLLEVALDKLLALTRFERGFILLLDADGRPSERLRRTREGSRGFDRSEAEFSGTIVRRVAASGESVSVSDIADDALLARQHSVVSLGLRQVMCSPMRSRGRVIGTVYIDSRRLAFEGHGIDLAFLDAFAAQLSLALENARLVADAQRQADLLAILAHEVRNPLAGIIGYADIGETEEISDEATELFGNIRRDGERLKRLVDNVLELARHETGNVDWSMAPFDMAELIADAVRAYAPQCEVKRLTIDADTSALDQRPRGNPDRIMQVLSNLIGNAVKFTPEGGSIKVTARTETVAADDPAAPPIPATEIGAWTPTDPTGELRQQFVRVDVTDTGPGMSEEVRARLFEKFAQGSGRQRTRGVGLGLYISRTIILRHGGSIFVDSEEGVGSTFSFRIPAVL